MMKLLKVILMLLAGQAVSNLWAVPLPPGKVQGTRSSNGASFTLTWTTPTFRTDGNLLAAGEVTQFKIVRTNALTGGTTSVTFTVPVSSPARYVDSTVLGRTFFYTVRAVDSGLNESQNSAAVSSDLQNSAYFVANDTASYAKVSGTLKASLDSQDVALQGRRLTNAEGNKVYKSIRFEAVDTITNRVLQDFVLASPAEFAIVYAVNGEGNVILNAPTPAVSYPDAAGAKFAFSLYWDNGSEFVKVGSSVDTSVKAASTLSRMPGAYQLRLVSQALSAQLNSVYPRVITPNNDGINDRTFFLFENPTGAQASGVVYDMTSSKVADLNPTDIFGGDTVLFWNGTDTNGAVVAGGVYIYKIEVGGAKFSGTVTVAR